MKAEKIDISSRQKLGNTFFNKKITSFLFFFLLFFCFFDSFSGQKKISVQTLYKKVYFLCFFFDSQCPKAQKLYGYFLFAFSLSNRVLDLKSSCGKRQEILLAEKTFFAVLFFTTPQNRLFITNYYHDHRHVLTSFLDLSSSQLKLLSNKAKKRLSTIKLPMTKAGKNMARQDSPTPYKKFTA